MTDDLPATPRDDRALPSTASTPFGRALGDAVVAHRITTGDTVLALTEGALNLLQKAETLLNRGTPEDRPRALALIVRALTRLPDASDTAGLPDIHAHVVRMHEHAAELRARAQAEASSLGPADAAHSPPTV